MSTFEAIILGIIQGLTEFLPISSSGHLELGQFFLGLTQLENYVLFNLICHLGTLLALIIVFAPEIKSAFTNNPTQFWQVFLGTLPLFPLVLIVKSIKALFDQPEYLGACFLFTAFLLYMGIRFGETIQAECLQRNRWRDAIVIGLFQAVAILPGVSRSGATISAGRMLGWRQQDAMTFAFLLAIPAILGGVTLEVYQLIKLPETAPILNWSEYLAGFFTSLIVGYFALRWLIKLAAKDKFIYFVWYCLVLGILTLFYFNT